MMPAGHLAVYAWSIPGDICRPRQVLPFRARSIVIPTILSCKDFAQNSHRAQDTQDICTVNDYPVLPEIQTSCFFCHVTAAVLHLFVHVIAFAFEGLTDYKGVKSRLDDLVFCPVPSSFESMTDKSIVTRPCSTQPMTMMCFLSEPESLEKMHLSAHSTGQNSEHSESWQAFS